MRNYCLRFAFSPSLDLESRLKNLVDFCEKAKIDDVMFFVGAEDLYEGHITIERAKRYTDVILKAKEILNKKGITISLNPWCTFSHYDAGRKLTKGQNFRTMVDADGTKAEVVVCPLCEEWQKYYIELMSFYVKTLEPKILWFEDDFRMSNHEPVFHGCFCDEHMKLYNKKLGTSYTREEFVKKMFIDEKVRAAYLDVTRETLESLLVKFTKNIDQPCFGLMTGGAGLNEGRDYDTIFSILGKKEKPYNRLCLHSYRQRGEQEYCWAINKESMFSRYLSGENVNCVSEIENIPHSLYTKSVNYMRGQMLTSLQMGFVGDTFSMFEFNGNGAINYEKYANMLAEIKPYLSDIEELKLLPSDAKGIKILLSKKSGYTSKCKSGCFYFSIQDGWLYAYLEQIGIACSYTLDKNVKGSIVGLSGQVLRNFSNDEIISLFKNNMIILTGDNIDVLKERNLLYLINVKDYTTYKENEGMQSIEELKTGDILYGIDKLRAISHYFCGDYYCLEYDNQDRKEYTQLLNHYEERVGAGITRVNNVLIFPYKNTDTDQRVPISLICYLREFAIKKAIEESSFNKNNFFVKEENVCPYAFEKNGVVYLICSNFSDDEQECIHIKTSEIYKKIQIKTVENPKTHDVEYYVDNGNIVINEKLKAQQSYVVVLE